MKKYGPILLALHCFLVIQLMDLVCVFFLFFLSFASKIYKNMNTEFTNDYFFN